MDCYHVGMIRTQISMTEEQAEGLRRLAALRQKSQAALLRDALDQLLADEVRQRRIELAREAIGRHRAPDDATPTENIAEDHDSALDEIYLT